eukprot:scaffold5292_cov113-Isochrysis_galbana.AAC.16
MAASAVVRTPARIPAARHTAAEGSTAARRTRLAGGSQQMLQQTAHQSAERSRPESGSQAPRTANHTSSRMLKAEPPGSRRPGSLVAMAGRHRDSAASPPRAAASAAHHSAAACRQGERRQRRARFAAAGAAAAHRQAFETALRQ